MTLMNPLSNEVTSWIGEFVGGLTGGDGGDEGAGLETNAYGGIEDGGPFVEDTRGAGDFGEGEAGPGGGETFRPVGSSTEITSPELSITGPVCGDLVFKETGEGELGEAAIVSLVGCSSAGGARVGTTWDSICSAVGMIDSTLIDIVTVLIFVEDAVEVDPVVPVEEVEGPFW